MVSCYTCCFYVPLCEHFFPPEEGEFVETLMEKMKRYDFSGLTYDEHISVWDGREAVREWVRERAIGVHLC